MSRQSWDWNPGSDVVYDTPFYQWWLWVLPPCPENRGWKLMPLASLSPVPIIMVLCF